MIGEDLVRVERKLLYQECERIGVIKVSFERCTKEELAMGRNRTGIGLPAHAKVSVVVAEVFL